MYLYGLGRFCHFPLIVSKPRQRSAPPGSEDQFHFAAEDFRLYPTKLTPKAPITVFLLVMSRYERYKNSESTEMVQYRLSFQPGSAVHISPVLLV